MTAEPLHELNIVTQAAISVVTLNRPAALNALTTDMRATLSQLLWKAARDPMTYAVVLKSDHARAFSAGSDVREIVAWAHTDRPRALKSFADEYALNWQWECFSKPTVSLINGMVMGGGVGITVYGTHRVGGEGYSFAMPETLIGLFPDVGVCHLFSRMPAGIGQYLGLTGRSITRADAYALGLLTHCIDAQHYPGIIEQLSGAWPVDPILDRLHQDPGPGSLNDLAPTINACFTADTVEGIMANLDTIKGTHREWAQGVRDDLARRSPLSLKITHRNIRDSGSRELNATLAADYRLAHHILNGTEFYEGVRAALIDKDRNPRWNPATLEDVTRATLDTYFASLGADELVLPTRPEMQAMRA